MRRVVLLAFVGTIGIAAQAWADQYPLTGVWAFVNPDGESIASTCAAYRADPEQPKLRSGQIIVFNGSQRVNYNGGYYEIETVDNTSVRTVRENEFLVTDRYYDDGEGGGAPEYKLRSYVLRIISPESFEERPSEDGNSDGRCITGQGCEMYVKCAFKPG